MEIEDIAIPPRKGNRQKVYPTNPIVDTSALEKAEAYMQILNEQLDGFFLSVECISRILCIFAENGILQSHYMGLNARIKDQSSIQQNSIESWEKIQENDGIEGKTVDDIFGMEIQTKTEIQKEIVSVFFRYIIDRNKEKYHDKTNGYRAYHVLGCFRRLDNIALYTNFQPEYVLRLIENIKLPEIPEIEQIRSKIIQKFIGTEDLIKQDGTIQKISGLMTLKEKDFLGQYARSIEISKLIQEMIKKVREHINEPDNMIQIKEFLKQIEPITKLPIKMMFLNSVRIAPETVKNMIEKSSLDDETKIYILEHFIQYIIDKQIEYKEIQDDPSKEQESEQILVDIENKQQEFLQYIVNNGLLQDIPTPTGVSNAFNTAINEINTMLQNNQEISFYFPVEMQIKTEEVAYAGIYDKKMSHHRHKNSNMRMILQALYNQTLLPGINSPLKFVAERGKIKLKRFDVTVEENYPFAQEFIEVYRRAIAYRPDDQTVYGESEEGQTRSKKFKLSEQQRAKAYFATYEEKINTILTLLAIEFPALRPYVKTSYNMKRIENLTEHDHKLIREYLLTLLLGQDILLRKKAKDVMKLAKLIDDIEEAYKKKQTLKEDGKKRDISSEEAETLTIFSWDEFNGYATGDITSENPGGNSGDENPGGNDER